MGHNIRFVDQTACHVQQMCRWHAVYLDAGVVMDGKGFVSDIKRSGCTIWNDTFWFVMTEACVIEDGVSHVNQSLLTLLAMSVYMLRSVHRFVVCQ